MSTTRCPWETVTCEMHFDPGLFTVGEKVTFSFPGNGIERLDLTGKVVSVDNEGADIRITTGPRTDAMIRIVQE